MVFSYKDRLTFFNSTKPVTKRRNCHVSVLCILPSTFLWCLLFLEIYIFVFSSHRNQTSPGNRYKHVCLFTFVTPVSTGPYITELSSIKISLRLAAWVNTMCRKYDLYLWLNFTPLGEYLSRAYEMFDVLYARSCPNELSSLGYLKGVIWWGL
jgi:hypothetical protein